MSDVDAHTMWFEELRLRHGVPGAVAGVLTPAGVQRWAGGVLGTATQVPATVDSVFKIGSITKVYTAALVALLAVEGRIDLDLPVSRQVPHLRLQDPEALTAITPRHLLTHTSGIDGDFYADTGRGDDSLARYVDLLLSVSQLHRPGETVSYCNAGFNLAGHLVAEVCGTTWERALSDLLLLPAGLRDTVTLPEEALLHRVAIGHHGSGPSARQTATWSVPRGSGPSATVAATVDDLLGFAALHLTGGVAGDGSQVLPAAAVDEMARPQVTVPAIGMGVESWGLGWWRTSWHGEAVLGHDGVSSGQRACLRVLPGSGIAVAVLSNGGQGNGFTTAVLAHLVRESTGADLPRPEVPAASDAYHGDDLVGVYIRDSEIAEVGRDAAGRLALTLRWVGPLLDGEEDDEDLTEHLTLRTTRRQPGSGVTDARVLVAHPAGVDPTAGPGEPVTVHRLADGRIWLHLRMRAYPRTPPKP